MWRREKRLDVGEERQYEAMRLYNQEVTENLVLLEGRLESQFTRAGLLVAASAIATGLATSGQQSGWTVVAMVLGSAAAVLGVIALWPRPKPTLNIGVIRGKLMTEFSADAVRRTADTKFTNVQPISRQIKRTAQFVRFGFLLLVAAIICSVLHALKIEIAIGVLCG